MYCMCLLAVIVANNCCKFQQKVCFKKQNEKKHRYIQIIAGQEFCCFISAAVVFNPLAVMQEGFLNSCEN